MISSSGSRIFITSNRHMAFLRVEGRRKHTKQLRSFARRFDRTAALAGALNDGKGVVVGFVERHEKT